MKFEHPTKLKDGEELKYLSFSEMPCAPICTAYTTWNKTGNWRYLRPHYIEKIPACQHSCPTANNIELWIRLLEKGEVAKAWEAALIENPFPSIMGRVCFHPCKEGCNRKELGGAVNINLLERHLADLNKEADAPKSYFQSTGKKIAIIGSGPGGLSAAYHLTRLGHKIDIFEKMPKAGGLLRYGIPEFRLPKDILDREINRLEEMGVTFKFSHPIKDAAEFQALRTDYDAILLSTGIPKSKEIDFQNKNHEDVFNALNILRDITKSQKVKLGKEVLVVGGGNTACDAARVARRMGANVTILYRRSREEMPAFDEELAQAEEERIKIETLVSPAQVILKGHKIHALECVRMKLGEPDESGRRKAIPIPDSKVTYNGDSILLAIGEEIDSSIIPSVLHVQNGAIETTEGGKTAWKDLFAVGDIVGEPRTVVDALAKGKSAAIAIDCYFNGSNFEDIANKIRLPDTNYLRMSRYLELRRNEKVEGRKDEVIDFSQLNLTYFKESKPYEYISLPIKERLESFNEVHLPATEKTATEEMGRCFHCGRCIECDNCFIYCPDISIAKKSGGYDINLDYCKGCGVCVEECPRAAMELEEEPLDL